MKQSRLVIITLVVLLLAAAVLSAPVMAAEAGTTEVRIAKYANDRWTVLNETTVDYRWLEANLPVQGDGVTRYYHQGPVFEGDWEKAHPGETYDGWNPGEDVLKSMLVKADLGAVMGTDIKDICNHIGGAEEGDDIAICSSDGWRKAFPYSFIYKPDPRQGPAVLCWYSGNGSGPDAQEAQGQGYPDTGYVIGMRMIFFADNTTNPWGWHIFGNNDMKECWDEKYWCKGGDYWSAAGTSGKWVNEIRIYSQDDPEPPIANFIANVTSGAVPLAVQFNDTSLRTPTTWEWDFGDGATSTEKNPVHTYMTPGTYTVTLNATNKAGSDIKEMSGIEAAASGGGGDDATELRIIKYANDGITILNEKTVDRSWLEANLPIQGDGVTRYYHQGPVTEAAWKERYPYKQYNPWNPEETVNFIDIGAVRGTDLADICDYVGGASAGDTITVNTSGGAAIAYPYATIYNPNPRQGPAVLRWYDGDAADYTSSLRLVFFADTSTNPDGRHVFGNTDMKVCWGEANAVYNGTLPSSADAAPDRVVEVRIDGSDPPASPVVSFSANVTSGSPPLTVQFTDTSSGSPDTWAWDFGDGATSTEKNPVHTYTEPEIYPGKYTVTLTATNTIGTNSTTVADCITLNAKVASFTASTTGGLPPLAVRFTDTSGGNPTAWAWDFGDGNTSTEQNPVHIYTRVGTYPVTLTVTGPFGSDTVVKTEPIDQIRVLEPRDIGTTTLRVAKVARNGTVLNKTTVDYHWLEENLPVQGDGVTNYYHQWWIFDDTYPDPEEKHWGSVFDGKGIFGAVKGTDVKDICDLVGGASERDYIRLDSRDGYKTGLRQEWVYNPHPRQGPAVLCWYNAGGGDGQGVGYTDTGYFPAMRLIFFADNSTNPWGLHIFGTYDAYVAWGVKVDATTGWSAKWIDGVVIEVDKFTPAPVADFTANTTSGDAPLTVAFTDNSTGADSWSWDFGDGATSADRNTTHTYTAPGTYSVNLTVTNVVGSNSATQTITVTGTGDTEPGETGTLTLHPGWNFVSTPKRLASGANTFAVFDAVDTAGHTVLLYDGIDGWKTANSTVAFRPLDGVWIYANTSYTIPLTYAADGPNLPPEKSLVKGWNAIGFTATTSRSAAATLRSVEDHWTTLIGFDAQKQEYQNSILHGAGDGRHSEERPMYPMQGYWLYMTGAETLGAIGA
ncbi:PKD domain-containing protein [Methanoculleus sp. UBA303]|jgi:PKD repeat protein|uniref:PKD domain-containing protein n=1 Tax=Methanoculleus sp. UBA303 TaxID=1915497 RepID=UPI0025D6972E|nr:PKD domain-containing protein [Methanoculleus sp. UBA303]